VIEITQAMIGPADPVASIEEEYAQALPRVRFLLEAFRGHDPSNNTAHGRMVYQLRWLERELVARRVPIPLDRGWIATLCYLVGSGEVDDSKEIADAMGDLTLILEGPGLLKPRHTPVVLSMLEDLIAAMHRYGDPLLPSEQELVEELSAVAAGMRAGAIIPPIGGGMNLPPLEKKCWKPRGLKGSFRLIRHQKTICRYFLISRSRCLVVGARTQRKSRLCLRRCRDLIRRRRILRR
jgi:hypothetical protein